MDRGAGYVRAPDFRAGLQLQRDGDCAGPASDVEKTTAAQSERCLHHVLGLRAGNQDVGCDVEGASIELLHPGDVLGGLSAQALVKIAAVVQPFDFAQLLLRVGVEIDAVAAESVGKEHFRSEPRCRDSLLFEKLRALQQSCVDGHSKAIWQAISLPHDVTLLLHLAPSSFPSGSAASELG